MKRSAVGAIGAQGAQALASLILQILVVRTLGLEGLGAFSIIYGVMVLIAAVVTGFVGDSLVVLPRTEPVIRSALEQYALGFAVLGAVSAAAVTAATGLVDPVDAVLMLLATLLFALEEVLRRLLMAHMAFWRVASIDLIGLAAALSTIGLWALISPVTIGTYFAAIAVGQTVAIGVGVLLLPREERFAVRFQRGGYGEVARYGSWRASQQLLRPALLTAVRGLVTVFVGLAATGLLETARVYVAPALLVISGLTSFLFVRYAREKDAPMAVRLRGSDKAVAAMLGLTALMGVALVLVLPWLGPLLFGTTPQLLAVVGWIVYSASVAAVTPYGALAAVGGRQALVFGIRAADTVLAILFAVILLLAGADAALVPFALAASSLLGGLALRFIVLRPGSGQRAEPE